jgi:hypothetical protein
MSTLLDTGVTDSLSETRLMLWMCAALGGGTARGAG